METKSKEMSLTNKECEFCGNENPDDLKGNLSCPECGIDMCEQCCAGSGTVCGTCEEAADEI